MPWYDLGPLGRGDVYRYYAHASHGNVFLSQGAPPNGRALKWNPASGFQALGDPLGIKDQYVTGVAPDGRAYGYDYGTASDGTEQWSPWIARAGGGRDVLGTYSFETHVSGVDSTGNVYISSFNWAAPPKLWDGTAVRDLADVGPDNGMRGEVGSTYKVTPNGVLGQSQRVIDGIVFTESTYFTPTSGLHRIPFIGDPQGGDMFSLPRFADRQGHVFGLASGMGDENYVWNAQHGTRLITAQNGAAMSSAYPQFEARDGSVFVQGYDGQHHGSFRWKEETGAVPFLVPGFADATIVQEDSIGRLYGVSSTYTPFTILLNGTVVDINAEVLAVAAGYNITRFSRGYESGEVIGGVSRSQGGTSGLFSWTLEGGVDLIEMPADIPNNFSSLIDEGMIFGGLHVFRAHWNEGNFGVQRDRMYLYQRGMGLRDLRDFFDSALTAGWEFESVQSIDSTGLAVGQGTYQGQVRWYAFQMVPEPGTWVALGLGSMALMRRRKQG